MDAERSRDLSPGAILAGLVLVCLFAGVSLSYAGFFIGIHPPFTRVDQGEANLWLSLAFLLTPAGVLLGYGLRGPLARALERVRLSISALSTRDGVLLFVSVGLGVTAVARLCHSIFLHDYPVTDDEWTARFGGAILAAGKLAISPPVDADMLPLLFVYWRDGLVTSMDWLGLELAWAFSELTGTGPWIFMMFAGATAACTGYGVARHFSRSWGLVAAALLVMSPMSFLLSMTTHAHVISRACVAGFIMLSAIAERGERGYVGSLRGLVLGAGLLTRPFEVAALAAPFLLGEALRFNEVGRRRVLLETLAVGSLALLLMALHAWAVTGGLLPPRHADGQTGMSATDGWAFGEVFGGNVSFNALRVAVFFLGPAGVLLVIVGASADRFSKTLGASVVSVFLLGMSHLNFGIHVVGPIHQSETVVPLTWLAVYGLRRLAELGGRLGWSAAQVVGVVVLGAAINSVGMLSVQLPALSDSNRIQVEIYERLEAEVGPEPSVVLAPSFGNLWVTIPRHARRGSWVFAWRSPDPTFEDPLLVFHDVPGAAEKARAAFPERKLYRIVRSQGPDGWDAVPIDIQGS